MRGPGHSASSMVILLSLGVLPCLDVGRHSGWRQ